MTPYLDDYLSAWVSREDIGTPTDPQPDGIVISREGTEVGHEDFDRFDGYACKVNEYGFRDLDVAAADSLLARHGYLRVSDWSDHEWMGTAYTCRVIAVTA